VLNLLQCEVDASDTIIVPDDYLTIQEAINNAVTGDTVYIRNGTYLESARFSEALYVNKSLTIIGEDKATTIIDGGGKQWCVWITVEDVFISNLTITNASISGVSPFEKNVVKNCIIRDNEFNGIQTSFDTQDCLIEDCTVYGNPDGIQFTDSENLTVKNCDIYGCERGVISSHSRDIFFNDVRVFNNSLTGLVFEYMTDSTLLNSQFHNNLDNGVYLTDSSNITFSHCSAYNNSNIGFYPYFSSDILMTNCSSYENNGDGYYLYYCEEVILRNCSSHHNLDDGINLMNLDNTNLESCSIYGNSDDGAYASYSNRLNFYGCTFHQMDIGVYLSNTFDTSFSNCIHEDLNYGVRTSHAYDIYVTQSLFNNCNIDGIYALHSEGVIVSSTFTNNIDEGIEASSSKFRAKYCNFKGNGDNAAETSSFYSRINATHCYWGNETGPYDSIQNPNGTGESIDGFVNFIPWLNEPMQPATISDLKPEMLSAVWRVIYPDDENPKPLACAAASVSDWLASAYATSKIVTYTEGLDTHPDYVKQTTGSPIASPGTRILTFGGPVVNPVVKHAEDPFTPVQDRAPLYFFNDAGIFKFRYLNGSDVPGAELPLSVINNEEDMFLIERFMDQDGRLITICYGFGWQGTYAAGKYFDKVIHPSLSQFTENWIIVKWEDSNVDGYVNNPREGDSYTIIASGS
jgi:parallel beta-helix repeat protein